MRHQTSLLLSLPRADNHTGPTEEEGLDTENPRLQHDLEETVACSIVMEKHGLQSPLNWRPAEDVLPAEPSPPMEADRQHPQMMVYTRRRRGAEPEAARPSTPAASNPPEDSTRSPAPAESNPTESFLNNISTNLPQALPVPVVPRRRRQAPATAPPRRRRRIAKLPPEITNQAAAIVCRRLGFTEANNEVSTETKDKYAAFFEKPLSRNMCELWLRC